MADVVWTPQKCLPTGVVPSPESGLSVSDNYKVRNDGKIFLRVINGGASPCVVTIATPGTVGGLAIADQAVSVANGATELIGPFPPSIYNDGSGDLDVTLSYITSVTVEVFHLG